VKKQPKSRSGGPRYTPEEREKAQEISQRSGLPERLALQVAASRLTLNEAIHQLMDEERAKKLMAQHGISRGEAFKVVRGHLSIEDLKLIRELRASPSRQADRLVLDELYKARATATFCCHGEPLLRARVTTLDRYTCELEDDSGSVRELNKHDLVFVSPTLDAPALEDRIGSDPEVENLGLGPSTTYKDRFRSSKRVLYQHYRDRVRTRVVFRDGRQIEGWIGWHGKWEYQLLFERPPADPSAHEAIFEVTENSMIVLRHAMHRLQAVG
jgi:uncharacterized protein YoaH (UPF0181 family)